MKIIIAAAITVAVIVSVFATALAALVVDATGATVSLLTIANTPYGPPRALKTVYCKQATVTAYTIAEDECGRPPGHPDYGRTADGRMATPGFTAAADDIELGTRIHIEGIGWRTVHDRFGGGYRGRVDINVETKGEAFEHGKQQRRICSLTKIN